MAAPGAKACGAKLSLKRRREGGGGGTETFSTKASWFENHDLSDAELSWTTLLRALDPQMSCSSLETFASLPEFIPESSQIANPQPKPETFNNEINGSQWVPFPVFCREEKATNSRNHQT